MKILVNLANLHRLSSFCHEENYGRKIGPHLNFIGSREERFRWGFQIGCYETMEKFGDFSKQRQLIHSGMADPGEKSTYSGKQIPFKNENTTETLNIKYEEKKKIP